MCVSGLTKVRPGPRGLVRRPAGSNRAIPGPHRPDPARVVLAAAAVLEKLVEVVLQLGDWHAASPIIKRILHRCSCCICAARAMWTQRRTAVPETAF